VRVRGERVGVLRPMADLTAAMPVTLSLRPPCAKGEVRQSKVQSLMSKVTDRQAVPFTPHSALGIPHLTAAGG
jgi:hypothetical protein